MLSASNDRLIKLILIILLNLMLPVASSDSNQTDNETISLFSSPSVPLVIVNPGDSIQDAIEESEPGCVIEVHGGVYSESINISKRISIRGIDDGNGLPVINAQENGSAITVSVDGVRFENLTINGSVFKDAGVNVTSINCTIQGVNVKINPYEIKLFDLNNNIGSWNNSSDSWQDIRLLSSNNASIQENDTFKNDFSIDQNYSRNNSVGWYSLINNLNGTEPQSTDSNYLMGNKIIGYGYVSSVDPFRTENIFGNYLSNHSYEIALNSSGSNRLSRKITYPIEYYSLKGNNISLSNYKGKTEYKFNYNFKPIDIVMETRDSTGWTNKSGARRNDWEYEALDSDSGKTLGITNDLRDSERILPAGGLEGEWLPCIFKGTIPPIDQPDEGWPSSVVKESAPDDDKRGKTHKKPLQTASSEPESNGVDSEELHNTNSVINEPLETREVIDAIRKEIMGLELGQIVFTAPDKMWKGNPDMVTARISTNLSEDLSKGLRKFERKEIDVSYAMEVELSGLDFSISALDKKRKTFGLKFLEWNWQVLPLNKGPHILNLSAYAIVTAAGDVQDPILLETFNKSIVVEVDLKREAKNAIFGSGKWLLLLFITVFVTSLINQLSGGIINKIKSLAKEKEPPLKKSEK